MAARLTTSTFRSRARANETRVEVDELVLSSPVAEARLQGTMDDWRALRYQMNITSTVDLTQLSEVLQPGAALRGVGKLCWHGNGRR